MIVDAEKDGVARLATKNDSRITPVGKVIRATRIDELPQLLNIFKGEYERRRTAPGAAGDCKGI